MCPSRSPTPPPRRAARAVTLAPSWPACRQPPRPAMRPHRLRRAAHAAQRRPRLHPERPVRAVLPRPDSRATYRGAGLDVTFQNQIDPELITLVGQGAVDIGMGDGTSVIPARSQGIPVRYAADASTPTSRRWCGQGRRRHREPGRPRGPDGWGPPVDTAAAGSCSRRSLSSADLTPDDLDITLYPTTGRRSRLAQGQVDAITGFLNNEPVIALERQGIHVHAGGR